MPDSPFFQLVVKRNTLPDGSLEDPGLYARMQHPICIACQERYREKFPDRPFGIVCKGIYEEAEVRQLAELSGLAYEETRELLDTEFWANRHIRLTDADGDMVPFVARWYQSEMLRCTARRKVDRAGRGTGKTSIGCIEELHRSTTRKNFPTLIACPAKAQAKKWYDDICQHLENDDELLRSVAKQQQQPYYLIKFLNGSTISIFTTGADSGKEAATIRTQSPRRVRLDEQDLLNESDYKAIMPLLRRFKESEFHGASTPTGKRGTYWAMCTQFQDYREFYYPISVHPDWDTEELNEEVCRREARTEDNYLHEFLAEFGDLADGVFKQIYVDAAKKPYARENVKPVKGAHYFMGVDWNGRGTGTRIRVIEYNMATRLRRAVDLATVDTCTEDSLNRIQALNRKWDCEAIFIDAGFGFVQDEMLRKMGAAATNPVDRKLKDVKVIDFGATIETNALVPRVSNPKYINSPENMIERRTKPFLVEGAVMCLEKGLFEFSEKDTVLEEQMRAYRVKTWSLHGFANTYESRVGDHDLDALMLALLAAEMKYGLLEQKPRPHGGGIAFAPGVGAQLPEPRQGSAPPSVRDVVRQAAGVPSRAVPETKKPVASSARLAWLARNGGFVYPNNGLRPAASGGATGRSNPGSRTAVFRARGTRSSSPYGRQ